MFDDTSRRTHTGVELIVLPVVVPATIQWIKHAFGHALLTICRTTQEVDHSPSYSTQDLLVVFQQFSIRLTVQIPFYRQIRHHNEWELSIRERVLLHTNADVTDPGGNNRHQFTVTVNVAETPILIGNNLLT